MEPAGKKSTMDVEKTVQFVRKQFDEALLPGLQEFIKIPNLSKSYDPAWNTNGLLENAANFLIDWATKQNVKGLKLEMIKHEGRSPVIYGEVAASDPKSGTMLYYGHFDKQPHMEGWKEGLGPITPVIQDGKLYGRGSADDGYSLFATILAIKTCQEQMIPHPRCVLLFEGDEESSSGDIEYYFEHLKDKIGVPDILFILDSGCFDYNHLWMTSSLRGCVNTIVKIEVTGEPVHSGDASGIIPETFRIARILLDRLDNAISGEVDSRLTVNIPGNRYKEAQEVAKVVGTKLFTKYPFLPGVQPVSTDPFRAYLNRIWKPQLSILGAEGLPLTKDAGNILRPSTTLKLSMRIPPTLNAEEGAKFISETLTRDPPYGSKITILGQNYGSGWNSPPNQPYLDEILGNAAVNFFGQPSLLLGEGASIPFLNFLEKTYPKAQFIVTGVLGPGSNAHSPNENLDLEFTKKLICCLSQVIADSYSHLKK